MKKLRLAVLCLLLLGCPEHEPQALIAQGNIKLDQSCIALPVVGSQAMTIQTGVLDLSINRYGYIANVQLVNFMAPSGAVTLMTASQFHLENNVILINGVKVSYEARGLEIDLPDEFFVHTPTTIFPSEAGIAAANVMPATVVQKLREDPWFIGPKIFNDPLLSDCYLAAGAETGFEQAPLGGRQAEILVRMTFEGSLLDGTRVYSNELKVPIVVCNGCLLSTQIEAGLFAQTIETGESDSLKCEVSPCLLGQDFCTDYESCFSNYFSVDKTADAVLATCASDELVGTFPPPSANAYLRHPTALMLKPYDSGADFGTRLNNLRFRYAFEKVNSYCLLLDEAPLWPPPK